MEVATSKQRQVVLELQDHGFKLMKLYNFHKIIFLDKDLQLRYSLLQRVQFLLYRGGDFDGA